MYSLILPVKEFKAVSVLAVSTRTFWLGALSLLSATGGSSSTAQALVPPTPKELINARRGVPFRGNWHNLELTKKGLFAKSILGFGDSKCNEAGSSPYLSAKAVFIRAATPEATSVCPMLPFTEPRAQNCLRSV